MNKYDITEKNQSNQTKKEQYADKADSYKSQVFIKRKKYLLLSLMVLELIDHFIVSLQEGPAAFRMCWLLLKLCIFFFVMYGTWKAGLLLWITQVPSAMLYIVSIQELLQNFSLDNPLLSIRIVLTLTSSAVSIFTAVWLTLVSKNRRYSER